MKFILVFLLMFGTANAETPLQVVTRVRNKYPNLPGNRPITNQALKEIAADPAIAGGIFKKTTGNNCLGYSCDIICYKDGRLYDVFGSWETLASPQWGLASTNGEAARCEMSGTTPVPPNPPANCDACQLALAVKTNENTHLKSENDQLQKDKAALIVENKRVYDQLVEWDKKLNQCLVDYNTLLGKYNSVSCKGFLGLPCTVVK